MLRSDNNQMDNYNNFITKSKNNSVSEISFSSFSQSSASIAGGGYASSLVASTIGSWDDEEQDYDEKSTKKVVEMLNELDNILFQDNVSKPSSSSNNTELIQECLQWSGLFPHIRIRATQIMPPKDFSFQMISHQEIRSASPYFYIPGAAISDHLDEDLSVSGIPVYKPFKPNPDPVIDPASFLDNENELIITGLNWSDENVQNIIPRLKSGSLEWTVFKIVEEVFVNDRSSTPTQDNPFQESKTVSSKHLCVKVVSSSSSNSLSATFKQNIEDQIEKEQCVFAIEYCSKFKYLLAHTIGHNPLYNIDYIDFAILFQDIPLYHHQHPSLSRFTSFSVTEELYTYQQTTVSHGQIDEFFALDDRDSSTKVITENHNPIKEDLIHSIFDDLWAEIYPKFQGIASKLADDLTSSKTYSVISTAVPGHEDSEEEEDGISDFDLLSAITIKPIPLQKRDMAASITRRVIDNPPSPEPAYYIHTTTDTRPSSAKQNLGFAGRPSRPTSAKPQEAYGVRLQTPVKFTSRQVLRSHHRLLPLSSAATGGGGGSHGLNEAMYVTSMAKPNSMSSSMSKKLPPLRGIISAVQTAEHQETSSPYPAKIQRHVAFDHQAEGAPKREMSPRPFSANRRPITGNLRSRTTFSRPHTAISESLSKLGSPNKLAVAMNEQKIHLNGTSFGRAFQRTPVFASYLKNK